MSIKKLGIMGMHLQKANIFGKRIPNSAKTKKNCGWPFLAALGISSSPTRE
jgi:hypothetical protein